MSKTESKSYITIYFNLGSPTTGTPNLSNSEYYAGHPYAQYASSYGVNYGYGAAVSGGLQPK